MCRWAAATRASLSAAREADASNTDAGIKRDASADGALSGCSNIRNRAQEIGKDGTDQGRGGDELLVEREVGRLVLEEERAVQLVLDELLQVRHRVYGVVHAHEGVHERQTEAGLCVYAYISVLGLERECWVDTCLDVPTPAWYAGEY